MNSCLTFLHNQMLLFTRSFLWTPQKLQNENVPPHLIPCKAFSSNRLSFNLLLPSLSAYNIGQRFQARVWGESS
ncbi:hypothetical protein ACSBR1_009052 [Camellia fascicularis]